MDRITAEQLKRALTGGLHVQPETEGDYGCSIEAAMAHVAASQLRAIRFAMVMGDPDDGSEEDDRRGWCVTGTFTRLDAVAALGGVEMLLRESHSIASEIREALGQPKEVEEAEGQVAS
jgi:hypothetical protein